MENIFLFRLRKLACPCVSDDQNIDVDDHEQNSGRPHAYRPLNRSPDKILLDFPIFPASFYCSTKEIFMRTPTNVCGRPVFEAYSSSDDQILRLIFLACFLFADLNLISQNSSFLNKT